MTGLAGLPLNWMPAQNRSGDSGSKSLGSEQPWYLASSSLCPPYPKSARSNGAPLHGNEGSVVNKAFGLRHTGPCAATFERFGAQSGAALLECGLELFL